MALSGFAQGARNAVKRVLRKGIANGSKQGQGLP